VLAAILPAQTVWNVPNGADLAPFIAQAAPGDVLQLAASHPCFTLDKGLVLRAAAAGTTIAPVLVLSQPFGRLDSAFAIPAGERARTVGVLFTGSTAPWGATRPPYGQQVVVQGSAAFEDCGFELWSGGPAPVRGAVDVLGGDVVFTRCSLMSRDYYVALRLVAGTCTLTNTTLRGPNHNIDTHTGWSSSNNSGLRQEGGVLVGSRLTIVGGESACGLCYGAGAAGLVSVAGSMFLTDSTVTGGQATAGPPGGAGIDGHTGVQIARNAITPGSGGFPPAVAVLGAVPVPELLGLGAATGPRRGQTFTATATSSAPAALLAFVGAFDWGAATVAAFPEPWWLPLGASATLALHAPAVGSVVTYGLVVPNVASLGGVQVWLQAAQVEGGALHVSAPVGGTIR
jgi:hypothetical protein